jgi:hypothetical protein
MADSTIYSGGRDGYVRHQETTSWNDAQGSATTNGDAYSNTAGFYGEGVLARIAGSRGSSNYDCNRSYFEFDLSGESTEVDSATISIRMDNLGTSGGNSAKAIMVEATALDGGAEDHGNVFSSGTTWHDDISDAVTISTTIGYHVFTMNSDGITLINNTIDSGGTMAVGLVSYHHDFSDIAPYANGDYSKFLVSYSEFLGTAGDPKLDLTYVVAVAADNATFFGANF